MFNLHTHSLLSDGCLLPSELAIRFTSAGYKAIAITDHVDYSNIESTVRAILNFTKHWPRNSPIKVLPGVELTHLPLEQFKPLANYARRAGIKVIIGHGETPIEPVIIGTNRAALEADIDILAHPGKINDADVKLAKRRGVFLEITSRSGHCQTNAFVAKLALKFGAKLILSLDAHHPDDILPPQKLLKVARNAGLSVPQVNNIYRDTVSWIGRISP
ncbi:MAG: histidinol phosphate phosphatase domain-containing protein [Candidatus Omnitrophica bacterium]|nr:histidinol phosphate phosphatase domain-containing protein [Candidatus Omnitrophota bacterium]